MCNDCLLSKAINKEFSNIAPVVNKQYRVTSLQLQFITATYSENKYDEFINKLKTSKVKICEVFTGFFKSLIFKINQTNYLIMKVNKNYLDIIKSKIDFSLDSKIERTFKKALDGVHNRLLVDINYPEMLSIIHAFNDCLIKYNSNYFEEFDWDTYDHISYFSVFYYSVIKIITDIFKQENNGGYVIHDAGTSNSNLSAMISVFNSHDLKGFKVEKIISSDILFNYKKETLRYLNEYKAKKNVHFLYCNLEKEPEKIPYADATVLLDVLEHFNNDEIAFTVLKTLWKKTKKVLIIHVPYEEKPNAAWGHHVSFNKEKLNKWATRLEGSEPLHKKYTYNKLTNYLDIGFMVCKKRLL